MIWLAVAAFATCGDDLPDAPASQSVVWISPLRKTVGANRRVKVVPVSALRAFAKKERLEPARALQLLGLRRSHKPPKRAWKVTVFEASSGGLCRPIERDLGTGSLAGAAVCEHNVRASQKETGCGRTRDRRSGKPGLELFHARWRDLAPRGFCVLPLDRFLAEL